MTPRSTPVISGLAEKARDVDHKLLEHSAGILGFSVHNFEANIFPGVSLANDRRELEHLLSSLTPPIISSHWSARPEFDDTLAGHRHHYPWSINAQIQCRSLL